RQAFHPLSSYADPVPLIASHEIANLPSASTLALLRKELAGRKTAPKTVIVLADPVFDLQDVRFQRSHKVQETTTPTNSTREFVRDTKTDVERSANEVGAASKGHIPRLPSTRQEAYAIASLVGGRECKLALDFAATHEVATATQISQYQIVHFATHALINS